MTREEYERRMREAVPHGPGEPCTCDGCAFCSGHELGCTCDIAWDTMAELEREGWGRE